MPNAENIEASASAGLRDSGSAAFADNGAFDTGMAWFAAHPWLQTLTALVLLLALAWLMHAVLRRYLPDLLRPFTHRLSVNWSEALERNRVLLRALPGVPLLLIHSGIALVPHLPAALLEFTQRLTLAVLAIVLARTAGALLNVGHDLYTLQPGAGGRPIKGYIQVTKLLIYLTAAVVAIAQIADQSPWYFISGLGAMTAIIMLIFRDTILSLVAGIQLVNNDLVRVGDWIEMTQFNADGFVIDIALNVVRVQNWDRTITVIPTHKFLEHSFRNWRGMFDSGGRRISRTVFIDIASIRFLEPGEIERFRRFVLLRDYIEGKERELAEWNATHCPEDGGDILANARHLTNIGTFRAYVTQYIRRHPQIHQEQLMLIRQMEPGPEGVGIQVYAFTSDTRWVQYEGIQGDIFDHILAIVPEFGLRVFQSPSGHDIARAGETLLAGRPGRSPAMPHVVDAAALETQR